MHLPVAIFQHALLTLEDPAQFCHCVGGEQRLDLVLFFRYKNVFVCKTRRRGGQIRQFPIQPLDL